MKNSHPFTPPRPFPSQHALRKEAGGIFTPQAAVRSGEKQIREQFPFLSSPDCPPELKILVSDKITAYYAYCQAHRQLFDCTSSEQQFSTVKQLVEAFIENRNIFEELDFYREHGRIRGDHPVFTQYEELRELRRLSAVELYVRKKRLEHNIWRITSQLKEKDQKGDVTLYRERRLVHKQNLLKEIDRLLQGIAQAP